MRRMNLPQYTDMVTRPRSLDDTIADLMGGNFTHAVVQHAVAELKRLGGIRRHMKLLSVEKRVSITPDTSPEIMGEMIKGYLGREISNHVAKFAEITERPTEYGTRTFRARAMMVPMALYDAVVPPLPKTTPVT